MSASVRMSASVGAGRQRASRRKGPSAHEVGMALVPSGWAFVAESAMLFSTAAPTGGDL